MANPMLEFLKKDKSKKKKGDKESKAEDIKEGGTNPKAMQKAEKEEVG